MIVFFLEDVFYIVIEYDDLNCLFGSLVVFFFVNWCEDFYYNWINFYNILYFGYVLRDDCIY